MAGGFTEIGPQGSTSSRAPARNRAQAGLTRDEFERL